MDYTVEAYCAVCGECVVTLSAYQLHTVYHCYDGIYTPTHITLTHSSVFKFLIHPHTSHSHTQAWSVLYPSWPSLVLLLWTCVIWLIPKINPRDSLFYTSPVLVLYTLVLLHLQYVYSLQLTSSELNFNLSLGPECSRENTTGCRTLVLLVKVLLKIYSIIYVNFGLVQVLPMLLCKSRPFQIG